MESAFAKPAGDIQSEDEEIEKPINFDAEDDLENVEGTYFGISIHNPSLKALSQSSKFEHSYGSE